MSRRLDSNKIILEGIEYSTLKSACLKYNLGVDKVRGRLRRGWSLEEAFGLKTREVVKNIIIDGNGFATIMEACKHYGKNYSSVMYKIHECGLKLEDVLLEKSDSISVQGKVFSDVAKLCLEYGVNRNTYESRINRGWSQEEALGIVERGKFVVGSLEFDTLGDACEYFGVPRGTYHYRKKRGYSNEEIFGLVEVDFRNLHNSIEVEVGDVVYRSISEACTKLGKKESTIKWRLDKGWGVAAAFDLEPLCRDGIIDTKYWNSEIVGVCIKKVISEGKLYFSLVEGKPMYLTKEELFSKWRELSSN